jgi:cobaltochelatase CobS
MATHGLNDGKPREDVMARLKFVPPLAGCSPRDIRGLIRDARIDGALDSTTREVVNADGSPAAHLTVNDDGSIALRVYTDPDNSALQRINRLLDGSGFRLRTYHRAGNALRMHGAGGYMSLPGTVLQDVSGAWTYTPIIGIPVAAAEPVVDFKTAEDEPVVAPEPTPAPEPVGILTAPVTVGDIDLLVHPKVTKANEVKVKAEVQQGLDRLWAMHVNGDRQVIALTGPTGTGKTSLVFNLAARHGAGVFTFDCAGAREFSDWVGVTHLKGDETVFVPSALLQVIDADGAYAGIPRIVNLDEVTRAESSGALNALIPMLHGFASLYIPEANRTVNVDPAVMFTMTANRGAQYTGTVGMDLALANRVTAWVQMDYADAAVEADIIKSRVPGISAEDASRLIGAADRIRKMDERQELPEGGGISTRLLIEAARKVAAGFSLHEAASWTWVGNYPSDGGTSSEAYAVKSAIDYTLRS